MAVKYLIISGDALALSINGSERPRLLLDLFVSLSNKVISGRGDLGKTRNFCRKSEPIAKPCIANFAYNIGYTNEFLCKVYIFFGTSLVFPLFGSGYTLFSMTRRAYNIGRHAE